MGEGFSHKGTLELNLTSVKESSKTCWVLQYIPRQFGMCKSETKATGSAQLEPGLPVLGFVVGEWIEERTAAEM